jgi:hypothetical protein
MPVVFDSNNQKPHSSSKADTYPPARSTHPKQHRSHNSKKRKKIHSPTQNHRLPHRTSTSLGAYTIRPQKVHFSTQGKDEQIILFLRKHPITQLPWILVLILITIVPFFAIPLLSSLTNLLTVLPLMFWVVFIIFYYMGVFAYGYVNFILWYYNINIVTNERVIDIDFLYLLVQEVTAARLTQVEDVTLKRTGSFSTLYDYGNVFVQTAGTEVNIEFLQIPKPRQVSQILIDLLEDAP